MCVCVSERERERESESDAVSCEDCTLLVRIHVTLPPFPPVYIHGMVLKTKFTFSLEGLPNSKQKLFILLLYFTNLFMY